MNWRIIYFSERVRSDVLALPPGIRADYLRLAELMEEHGADLRMPHSKAMGSGLFELHPKGPEGIGRVLLYSGRADDCCASFIRQENTKNTK